MMKILERCTCHVIMCSLMESIFVLRQKSMCVWLMFVCKKTQYPLFNIFISDLTTIIVRVLMQIFLYSNSYSTTSVHFRIELSIYNAGYQLFSLISLYFHSPRRRRTSTMMCSAPSLVASTWNHKT